MVRPNPHSAACTGSTGSPDSVATARSVMIHSPPGSFTSPPCTVCTALSRLAISVSSRAADFGGSTLLRSGAGAAPDDAGERHTALVSLRQQLPQGLRIGGPVERDAARHVGRQFVESGNQPGAVRSSGAVARRRRRHLVPAKGVQQPGGVAAEPAQQRLSGRAFDRELANPAQLAAIPIDEIEIEDLGFAVEAAGVPLRAAVEPPRHLLPQHHLPVPQRQEQIVHALFGREKCRERREGDSGAQVHQHRMHRLGSEVLGELFADGDVADRLTLAKPQRLQGTGPVGPPRQLHVGEGLEQLLRTHAVHPLDCRVDGIRLLGCRLVIDTGDDGAIGVQRPFGITNTVRAAVHLEGPAAAVLERMQRQLYLARSSSRAG